MRLIIKTPITYYGGKQKMVKDLLPLIPEHDLYTEDCAGGLALFFAKEPSKVEVINDINGEVMNFYEVLQTDYLQLYNLVQTTLHSRQLYTDALVIYRNPHLFSPIKRAWSFWILTNQGFVSKVGSWGYDRLKNSMTKKVDNQKSQFGVHLRKRLENVQLESNDLKKVIGSRDIEKAFHYIDPPYPDTNQGHYKGYTVEDFTEDLEFLTGVKGKFLLSSFRHPVLTDFVQNNGWHTLEFEKASDASTNKDKKKIEVLTANYDIQTMHKRATKGVRK